MGIGMRWAMGFAPAVPTWVLIALLLPVGGVGRALAQQGCGQGIVRLPGNVNGQITLCPAVVSQAPELAGQIAGLQKAAASQQAQVQELTRLLRGLNQAGQGLALKQQSELLRNVLLRLGDPATTPGDRLIARSDALSGHFEQVSAQVDVVIKDPRTAARTAAGLHGNIGNAISRLDFETASDELESISAQLKELNRKVDTVDQTTRKTLDTVEAMHQDQQRTQQLTQQQQADAKLQSDLAVKRAQDASDKRDQDAYNNPDAFVRLMLQGLGGRGAFKLHANLFPSVTVTDPRLEVLIRSGTRIQRVLYSLPPRIDSMQTPEAPVESLGNEVTLCFSAVDTRTSVRRLLRETFQAEYHGNGLVLEAFYRPAAAATLTPDMGAPCQRDSNPGSSR